MNCACPPSSRHAHRRIATMAAAALLAAVATACGGGSGPAADPAPPTADLSAVRSFEITAQAHVATPVQYDQSPPVGGDHNPVWQNCGSYTEVVANEMAVHSMEHGAVWIAHDPGLAEDDIRLLRARAEGQTHVLVTPYAGLGQRIVLSAWGKQLTVDTADDLRIAAFVAAYQQGPQTPEPGAPCSGATGEPL